MRERNILLSVLMTVILFWTSCTSLDEQAGKFFIQGTQFAEQGKNLEAAQNFAKAAELRGQPQGFHEIGLPNSQYKAAYYYDEAGKPELAIEYYALSAENWKKVKDKENEIALCYSDMAYVYNKKLNNQEKAIEFYEKALDLYSQIGWNKSMGKVLYALSNIYWNQKKKKQSLEMTIEAASNFLKGKDWEKAKKYYQEAQKLAQENNLSEIREAAEKGLGGVDDAPLMDGINEEPLPNWANYAEYRKNDPIQVIIQSDHLKGVKAVKFSPDGRFLATASEDETIKIWDMNGHVVNVLVHPRNDDIAFISSNANIRKKAMIVTPGTVWSANGHLLQQYSDGMRFISLNKHESTILAGGYFYAFDNEYKLGGGRYRLSQFSGGGYGNHGFFAQTYPWFKDIKSLGDIIVIGDEKGNVQWTDYESHNLRTVQAHTGEVIRLVPTPDGKSFLSASKDGTVKEWDAREGSSKFSYKSFGGPLKAIAMHPNGKLFAAGSDKQIDIWGLGEKGQRYKRIERTSADGALTSLDISPDGKYIAAGSEKGTVVRIWSITGESVRESGISQIAINAVAIHPDSQLIASGTDSEIRLWDIRGQLIKNIPAHTKKINALEFSADGKYLVSCSDDQTIKLWTAEGELLKTMTRHLARVNSVTFHPNSQLILSGSDDGRVILWNLDGTIKNQDQFQYYVQDVVFHPGGNKFALGLGIVGIGDKNLFQNMSFPKDQNPQEDNYVIEKDLEMKTINELVTGNKAIVRDLRYTPDGEKIIVSNSYYYRYFGAPVISGSERILVWDLKKKHLTGTSDDGQLNGIHMALHPHQPGVVIVATKRGKVEYLDFQDFERKQAREGTQYQAAQKEGPKTAKKIKTLVGHFGPTTSITISPNQQYLVSGSLDGTIKVWNMKNDYNISMAAQGEEWIVYSNDGYFDSSRNNGQKVSITKGLDVFSIDQFAIQRNRPDLYLTKMELGSPELIGHYYAQYLKRLKKADLLEKDSSELSELPITTIRRTKKRDKNISIDFTLEDKLENLKSYNIFVNDVPIFGAYGKPISGHQVALNEQVELTSGKNKIEISCLNEKGAESYRALTNANYDQMVEKDLYFIGFGVSKYKNSELNLKFAHKDAKDIATTLSKIKKQFHKVRVKTFLDDQVTLDAIKNAKSFLADAKVDDTFILFIAGHGVHDTDKEATYYYLTHEADVENLSQTAANFDLVEDLLQGIAPRNKLFLMDTCESGEVEDTIQEQYFSMANTRGIKARTTRAIKLSLKKKESKSVETSVCANEQGQRGIKLTGKSQSAEAPKADQTACATPRKWDRSFLIQKDRYVYNDLIRRSGTIVFSSSKGGEFSYESEKIENGYFTEEIIKALTGKQADTDNDGMVNTDELRKFVSTEVPKYTQNQQHPTVDRDNIFLKFALPLVQ